MIDKNNNLELEHQNIHRRRANKRERQKDLVGDKRRMMREIKFRAWDVAKKRMFTPSYEFDKEGELCTDILFCNDSESNNNGLIPMQYTGLKDKNGKEIYEGDVVLIYNSVSRSEFDCDPSDDDGYHVVKIPEIYHIQCTTITDEGHYFYDDMEVIGNIHEATEEQKKEWGLE